MLIRIFVGKMIVAISLLYLNYFSVLLSKQLNEHLITNTLVHHLQSTQYSKVTLCVKVNGIVSETVHTTTVLIKVIEILNSIYHHLYAVKTLQQHISAVQLWMTQHCLKLNTGEIEIPPIFYLLLSVLNELLSHISGGTILEQ